MDHEAVGLRVEAFVLVVLREAHAGSGRPVRRRAADLPQVLRADAVTGPDDVLLHVVAADTRQPQARRCCAPCPASGPLASRPSCGSRPSSRPHPCGWTPVADCTGCGGSPCPHIGWSVRGRGVSDEQCSGLGAAERGGSRVPEARSISGVGRPPSAPETPAVLATRRSNSPYAPGDESVPPPGAGIGPGAAAWRMVLAQAAFSLLVRLCSACASRFRRVARSVYGSTSAVKRKAC